MSKRTIRSGKFKRRQVLEEWHQNWIRSTIETQDGFKRLWIQLLVVRLAQWNTQRAIADEPPQTF